MNCRTSMIGALLGCQLSLVMAADNLHHVRLFSKEPTKSRTETGRNVALPPVAASFRTTRWIDVPSANQGQATRDQNNTVETTRWRMWRDTNSIAVEDLDRHIGESWLKDPHTTIHRKIAHNEKVIIEFQPDDLRVLDASSDWSEKATLLNTEVMSKLSQCPSTGDMQEYCGNVGGYEWKITFDPVIGLPRRIERRSPQGNERTELTAVYALKAAPWQPTSSEKYEVVDFSDIGDRESDPTVTRAVAELNFAQSVAHR